MIPLTVNDMQILIAAVVFAFGCISVLLGVFILLRRGFSREMQTIAKHSALMGQKGVAKDVTGLVSSASDLVTSINSLVRTSSGVGIILITLGMVMIAGSYWIISQLSSFIS
jgi:hypothetical protein